MTYLLESQHFSVIPVSAEHLYNLTNYRCMQARDSRIPSPCIRKYGPIRPRNVECFETCISQMQVANFCIKCITQPMLSF